MRTATAAILGTILLFSASPTHAGDTLGGEMPTGLRDRPLEGFGTQTPGGAGGTGYEVTSLADSGPGTLRDALSSSNRVITFAVGGTIALETTIRVSGHHITIDGATAPPPGITIAAAHVGVANALLELKECHDIILRNVRIRDAPDTNYGDNLRIWDDAYNIVVDHCSFRRGGDGALDISDGAHDVTIQWCIIAETVKNSLIRTGVYNLSLHHNLYVEGDERNPQLDDASVVDMVNNVVSDWYTNYGTRIRNGSSVNLVRNYYLAGARSDQSDAIVISEDAGPVYMEDNVVPPACPASATTETRFPAPPVTEMGPTEALAAVAAEAGAWPRDADDENYALAVTGSPVEAESWGRIKSMYR